jgi:hypothetical protein
MANLSKALNTDMAGLAQILRKKGRGKDSVLAHITPKEAALLKARGGSGTINPDTGLPEFDDYSSIPDVASQQDPAVLSSGEGNFQLGSARTPEQASQNVGFGYQVSPDVAQPAPYYGGYSGETIPTGSAIQGVSADIAPQFQISQPIAGQAFGTNTGIADTGFKPQEVSAAPETPNLFEKAYDKISNYASSDKGSDTLTKMGLATALGLYGASTNRAAAAGNRAATAETQAIAAPYQQQGQNLIAQAQAGTLSPASQQAYAAAQAQLAQAKSGRGGVGAQQTANQMATLYQTLLNNQYTYGLQVAQIGDNIAVGAIKQGLAMDQSINQSTQNFYTNLAGIVAGVPGRTTVIASNTGQQIPGGGTY